MHYPYENFYEALAENAKLRPRKSVIFIDDQQLNNRKLKTRVDTFARYLETNGVTNGDKVALIVENSEEFVIAVFAITKIGAIVIPINTFLKHDEFAYILNDCGAKMLLSSVKFGKDTRKLLETTQVEKIVWVGELNKEDEVNISFNSIIDNEQPHVQISTTPTLDDTACIIYTSGTTGKPKGAMLSYRNIYSNVMGAKEIYNIVPKDRFIVYLPMFHAFTFSIIVMLPLLMGSSIVIVKSVFPFSNVLKQVLLKRVTVFLGVPTVYNALNKAKIPWYFLWFNKVRVFISGASALNEAVIDGFSKKFKRATIVEGYGLSECSPAVAVNRLDRQKALSVGLPMPGYEIKIVDDEMIEVETGEIGEIIVKGDCVMQGYYGHEDATESVIINGWLKTGDLGKLDEDGFLFIVDRKKDLIISKGINVYPREVEEALAHYDGVELSAVVGQKDKAGDEDVVAFIQLQEGVEVIPEKVLKSYLKKHLANYKIPKHIYTVEELPKNATGKVLKRILKEELEKGEFLIKDTIINKKEDEESLDTSCDEEAEVTADKIEAENEQEITQDKHSKEEL